MDRYELHGKLSDLFPNSKEFLVRIFMNKVSSEEIAEKAKKLKGTKILVRFREDKEVYDFIKKTGLDNITFYNAFLEWLIEEFGTVENIEKEIERWKENSILHFV